MQYLYDQITLAPFIYVDETAGPTSPSSLRAPSPHSQLGQSLGPSASSSSIISPSGSMSGPAFFNAGTSSKNKVDPYQLIASGQTRRLRVDVESMVPPRSPFSFTGTTSFFVSTVQVLSTSHGCQPFATRRIRPPFMHSSRMRLCCKSRIDLARHQDRKEQPATRDCQHCLRVPTMPSSSRLILPSLARRFYRP